MLNPGHMAGVLHFILCNKVPRLSLRSTGHFVCNVRYGANAVYHKFRTKSRLFEKIVAGGAFPLEGAEGVLFPPFAITRRACRKGGEAVRRRAHAGESEEAAAEQSRRTRAAGAGATGAERRRGRRAVRVARAACMSVASFCPLT